MASAILIIPLGGVLFYLLLRWISSPPRSQFGYPLPPGPKPLPIIGNLFDIPIKRQGLTFRQWTSTFNSDLIFLHVPSRPIVVIGSRKVAVDLLEKRSHIYSDRPTSSMARLLSWEFNFGLLPYGSYWRAHRRTFHQYFHQGVVDRFRPGQLKAVRSFLSWVLDSPEEIKANIRLLTTSIIFWIVYGIEITGLEDEYVTTAEKAIDGITRAVTPGAYWTEMFPIFRHIPSWVPGNSAGKLGDEIRPLAQAMRNKPFDVVREAAARGTAVPSFALSLIERMEKLAPTSTPSQLSELEDVARNVTGMTFAAGTETTASSIESFTLAMALFPNVQKKAQEELDRIVGPDRLPDYEDIESLTYIRATAVEAMRWNTAFPTGFPHRLTEDDVYNGYFIPKGTITITNTWAMLRDPTDFPSPEEFNPERYIQANGQLNTDLVDLAMMGFGFGRRICPGRHFSNNTLVMTIASILHVFEISPGFDEEGDPIELSTEVGDNILSFPLTIPHGFKPRSRKAELLVRAAAMEA